MGRRLQRRSRRARRETAGRILKAPVAAVSAGVVEGVPLLDLNYPEDSSAEVDLNVVRLGASGLIEVQGTAEGEPFERELLDTLVDLGASGIRELVALQKAALGL